MRTKTVRIFVHGRVITSVLLCLVFFGALWEVTTFNSVEARTMPLVIGIPTALMAFAIMVREIRAALRTERERGETGAVEAESALDDPSRDGPDDDEEGADEPQEVATYPEWLLWTIAGFLALSILLLGHQVGMTVFLLVAQRYIFRLSVARTLITTAIVMGFFGWFWVHVLNLPVFTGVLGLPII